MKASLLYRILGLVLIGFAIYGWIVLPNRTELGMVALLLAGLVLVAKDRATAYATALAGIIAAWRQPPPQDDDDA